MKFTKLLKAAVVSAGISASAVCFMLPAVLSGSQCQVHADTVTIQECINASQQNWYSWFQGKSRSTQFHFIDLLELLSRLSPAQKN